MTNIELEEGQWYHVATTWDAENKEAKIFVDGNDVSVVGETNAGGGSSEEFNLGRKSNGDSITYFDGAIRDLRVWNEVLTSEEISSNKSLTLTGSETNLVAYYQGNVDSNNSLINSSENNLKGTLENGTIIQSDNDDNLGSSSKYIQFDGDDDYVDLPFLDIFNNIATEDITLEFWLRGDDLTENSPWMRILDATQNSNNFIQINIPEDNKLQFSVEAGGIQYATMTDIELKEEEWYHVATTWDAQNQEAKIFIDGNDVSVVGETNAGGGSNGEFNLGRRSDGD